MHNGDIVVGTEAINISSMECGGVGDKISDYEITTFLHNEENRVVPQKADEDLAKFLKDRYDVRLGIIGSGDIWNKNIDRIRYINEKYGVICEDMECVSVYTVANLYDVPVIRYKDYF